MNNSKPFWLSKTLWINAAGLAVVIVQYLGNLNYIDPKLVVTILGVLNMFLRLNGDATQTKNLTLK